MFICSQGKRTSYEKKLQILSRNTSAATLPQESILAWGAMKKGSFGINVWWNVIGHDKHMFWTLAHSIQKIISQPQFVRYER